MRVLSAVFAYSGQVTLYIAHSVPRFSVKRRGQQSNQPVHRVRQGRKHGFKRFAGVNGVCENRKTFAYAINGTFRTVCASKACSVTEKGTYISVFVPRVAFNCSTKRGGFTFEKHCPCSISPLFANRQQCPRRKQQQPADNNAFAAVRTYRVHAVVPITRAHKRQTVRPAQLK